jgi:hypothetical protein
MRYLMMFEAFNESLTKHQEFTMNNILDKISKDGVDSLTPEERKMLNNIEDIEAPVPDILKDTEIPDGGYGNKVSINKKYFDSSKKIAFLLKEVTDKNDEVMYFGEIHFQGDIYIGEMTKNKETEQPFYLFINTKNGEEFEPSNYDLHYEFDDLMQEVFYDESINKDLAD